MPLKEPAAVEGDVAVTKGIPSSREATNGDLRTVQEYLGHADPKTTAIYAQVRPTRLREAVALIDYRPNHAGHPDDGG